MSRDLLDLEEVGQGGLAFGLLFGALHGSREIVDEVRVDLEDEGLGEDGDEDVADLFFLVPIPDGLGECDSEECVTIEYFWNLVEEKLYLVVA